MKEPLQQHVIPQKCPLCDAAQKHLSYTPLTGEHKQNIIHVTCSACGGKIIAFIAQHDMGVATVGIATDLSVTEARTFLVSPPVTQDDVLSFYAIAGQTQITAQDFIF